MRSMNMAMRVYTSGLLAALVVLLVPGSSVASDSPTVRITRPGAGRVVLDVSDATVTVTKEITADRSVVTMGAGEERVSLTVRRGVVTVSDATGTFTVEPGTGGDSERLLMVLRRSVAANRARVVLAKITEGPETFAGQSMLLTRAILESGSGHASALLQHRHWVAQQAADRLKPAVSSGRPKVFRANYLVPQKMGPGECWDAYHKEAIRIADDFAECTADLKWYEAHLWAGCSLIYAVRSEGALAWYIACNGGVPFSG
jgi:hypothetical protein